jgi:hypothetical protein
VVWLRFVCRRCLAIYVSRLTKRATGTPNPLRVFGARALIVSGERRTEGIDVHLLRGASEVSWLCLPGCASNGFQVSMTSGSL